MGLDKDLERPSGCVPIWSSNRAIPGTQKN